MRKQKFLSWSQNNIRGLSTIVKMEEFDLYIVFSFRETKNKNKVKSKHIQEKSFHETFCDKFSHSYAISPVISRKATCYYGLDPNGP